MIRTISFVPNEGTEKIKFGTKRADVRKMLDGFVGEFKKNKFSKNSTDDFGYCHIYYNVDDEVEAIEFFDDVELMYDEVNLFSLKAEDIESIFKNAEEDYGSYTIKDKSIGIYTPGNVVESILIGCKGYYG